MKFGKEFASQTVPEWQEAYMDYNYLKALLKDALRYRERNASPAAAPTPGASLKRRVSLYRAFSGLTNRYNSFKGTPNEDEAILVNAVEQEGSEEAYYQTVFLMSSDEGGDFELVFFRRLDEEFNKVLKFYKGKVKEVMKEAVELNKQMDALIAFRIRVDNFVVGSSSAEMVNLETKDFASSQAPLYPSMNGRKPGKG